MAPLNPADIIASRLQVFATKELLDHSYLDPASVKSVKMYRGKAHHEQSSQQQSISWP